MIDSRLITLGQNFVLLPKLIMMRLPFAGAKVEGQAYFF